MIGGGSLDLGGNLRDRSLAFNEELLERVSEASGSAVGVFTYWTVKTKINNSNMRIKVQKVYPKLV